MGGHAWVRLVAVEIFLAIADLAFSTFQEPLEKFVPFIASECSVLTRI